MNFQTRSNTTAHIPKLVYVKPRYSAEIAVNFTQIPLQRVRIILNVRCSASITQFKYLSFSVRMLFRERKGKSGGVVVLR